MVTLPSLKAPLLIIAAGMALAAPAIRGHQLESLVRLKDLPDSFKSLDDKIAFTSEHRMGIYSGFEAFTGHELGKLWKDATYEKSKSISWCPTGQESETWTYIFGVDDHRLDAGVGEVFSVITGTLPTYHAGGGHEVSRVLPPPPTSTGKTSSSSSTPDQCETCTTDSSGNPTGRTTSRQAEATLLGDPALFDGEKLVKPKEITYQCSQQDSLTNTSYITRIDLLQSPEAPQNDWIDLAYDACYSTPHPLPSPTPTGAYAFKLRDYRWREQHTRFELKNLCPGTYLLYYTVGKFDINFERPLLTHTGHWFSTVERPASQNGILKRIGPILVVMGENGRMIEPQGSIPLSFEEKPTTTRPEFPVHDDETSQLNEAYELITSPEQLQTYGSNPNWHEHEPILVPLSGGCASSCAAGPQEGGSGAGNAQIANGSVSVSMDLGTTQNGRPVGFLILHSESIDSQLLKPDALRVISNIDSSSGGELHTIYQANNTPDGEIRQIRTHDAFVDVVTTSPASYEIRFYHPEAVDPYDPDHPIATPNAGHAPFKVWSISLGSAAGTVRVQGPSPSSTPSWEFRGTTNGVELAYGNRIETVVKEMNSDLLIETKKIRDVTHGLLSNTRKKWVLREEQFILVEDAILDTQGEFMRGLVHDDNSDISTYKVGAHDIYYNYSFDPTTYYNDGYYDYSYSTTQEGSTNVDLDGDDIHERWIRQRSENTLRGTDLYSYTIEFSAVRDHDDQQYLVKQSRTATNPNQINWNSPGMEIDETWRFATGPEAGKIGWQFLHNGETTRWTYGTLPSGNLFTTQETGTPNPARTAFLFGTRRTEIKTPRGEWVSSETRDIHTNLVLSSETVLQRDPDHGAPTLVDRNGRLESREYSPCCGRLEKVTEGGLIREILHDQNGREAGMKISTVAGEFISGYRHEIDALGRIRKRYQILADDSERLVSSQEYDLAGVMTSSWNLEEGTTNYSESANSLGQWVLTTTRPESNPGAGDALTEIAVNRGDGTPFEFYRNGKLVTKWTHYSEYGIGYSVTETRVGEDSNGNQIESETSKKIYDLSGKLLYIDYPFPVNTREERAYQNGRLHRQTDPDGVQTLFAYSQDGNGEHFVQAVDMDRDGIIDYNATGPLADRITKRSTTYAMREGVVVRKISLFQWIGDGDVPQLVSKEETAIDGSRRWETVLDSQTTSSRVTVDPQHGLRTETTTFPDNTEAIRTSLDGRIEGELRKDSNGSLVTSVSYEYDTFGRMWKITDARGTTTLTYHTSNHLQTITTPAPDDASTAQVTSHDYNSRGELTETTFPDGKTTHRSYWPDGSIKRIWGARTYPEYRTYDRQGRLKTLTTWQDYNPDTHTGTGQAITTWNYHPQRGWLENKRYQDSKGPAYTYTAAGRLHTRTWARTVEGQPLVTTYGHNAAGEPDSIDYSDATPDVFHVYDRIGRPDETTDAAGKLTRSYHPDSLRLWQETYTSASGSAGILVGRAITRGYDTRHRPDSLGTDSGYLVNYGYDAAGRLEQVNQGFHAAWFGYEPGTSAHTSTTIKRTGAERVRHERLLDALGRVDLVRSVVGGVNQVLRDYTMNAANQRTQVELETGYRWSYLYDDLGQITAAQKRTANGAAFLPGYGFGYKFDDIGNRTRVATNSRLTSYTPDVLNRYEERQVAGAVDVRGEANVEAVVTVNGLPTTRTGKDFYREMLFTNSNAPVHPTVEVEAVLPGPGGTASEDRSVFLPQTPEAFVHDDDGNLTADGRWTYAWDAENRLVGMETRGSVAAAFPELKRRIEFAYDSQGRRIRKMVKTWDSSLGLWSVVSDTRFLYDEWNLLSELDALDGGTPLRSYVWGLDLSGTMQGAGGVGGLLWVNTPIHTFAACGDANGNVVCWTNTASLVAAGRAEYGPFGEVVQATGVAREIPFGFSTKYADTETALLYYGFRYYNPSTGRWPSRDPIEERGGLNLYGFAYNNPMSHIDTDGRLILYTVEYGPGRDMRADVYDRASIQSHTTGWIDLDGISETDFIVFSAFKGLAVDRIMTFLPPKVREYRPIVAAVAVASDYIALDARVSGRSIEAKEWIGRIGFEWNLFGANEVRWVDFEGVGQARRVMIELTIEYRLRCGEKVIMTWDPKLISPFQSMDDFLEGIEDPFPLYDIGTPD